MVFVWMIFSGWLAACQSPAADNSQQNDTTQPTNPTAETTQLPFTNLDVAAFKEKMKEPGVVILDVRTPEETAQGKIAGAEEINFYADNFESEIDKLDRDKTYLVYCRSGNRSSKTCKLMASKGFKKCYNLVGGYNAWVQQQ